jgi:hypothetical protein
MLFTLVSLGENWPWDRRRIIFPFERERANVLCSMRWNRTRTFTIKLLRGVRQWGWEWLWVWVLILLFPVWVPQQARLTDRKPHFLMLKFSYYSCYRRLRLKRLYTYVHILLILLARRTQVSQILHLSGLITLCMCVLRLLNMCSHTIIYVPSTTSASAATSASQVPLYHYSVLKSAGARGACPINS